MELMNLLTLEAKLSSEYDRLRKYLATGAGAPGAFAARSPQYYREKIARFQRENAELNREVAHAQRQSVVHGEKLQRLEGAVAQSRQSSGVFAAKEQRLAESVLAAEEKGRQVAERLRFLSGEKADAEAALTELRSLVAKNAALLLERTASVHAFDEQNTRLTEQLAQARLRGEALSSRLAQSEAQLTIARQGQTDGSRMAELLSAQQRLEALRATRAQLSALYSHLVDQKSQHLAQYKKKACGDRQAQLRENLRAIESLEQLAAAKVQEIRALR